MRFRPSSDAVVSLFSGAGGMSLGFAEAGLKPSLAADFEKDACATYAANLGDAIQCLDLEAPTPKFMKELSRYEGAFALIGGPPCQGFSSAGLKRSGDARNKLIFSYLNIVEVIRPRWFLFENVEGLLTSNDGESVTDLVRSFISIGYRVRLEKVNFAAYGLPQARKRVLLIGNRIGVDFELPAKTHSYDAGKHRAPSRLPQAPSFDEAVASLGRAVRENRAVCTYVSGARNAYDAAMRVGNTCGGVDLHAAEEMSESMQKVLQHLSQGQTMKDVPETLWHESFRRRAFRRVMDGTPTERRGGSPSGVKRLVGNLNALTITSAATREFIHPHENRPLTLREAARLQSFPDRYTFEGGAMSIARQIGNAFPPLAASRLAMHLATLDGQAGAGVGSFKESGALIGFHLTDAMGMSPALAKTDAMLAGLSMQQVPLDFNALMQRSA
ncbi:MAG: DNA cytosine methyltransferase [Bosea sp.]|nr:DNA cytosine methyltransferase [Bosea sp. (in: a-proteobacteria)]